MCMMRSVIVIINKRIYDMIWMGAVWVSWLIKIVLLNHKHYQPTIIICVMVYNFRHFVSKYR